MPSDKQRENEIQPSAPLYPVNITQSESKHPHIKHTPKLAFICFSI